MGTQFWWFYDVLIAAITGCILYNAVAKGFNRMLFPLIGSILAVVVGFFGSDFLAPPVYEMLFQDTVTEHFEIEYTETELYPAILDSYNNVKSPDAPMKEKELREALAQETVPEALTMAVGQTVDTMLHSLSPLPQENVSTFFVEHPAALRQFLDAEDAQSAASAVESHYLRPFYVSLVRMGLFLLLMAVVLILMGIISNMAGSLEELMHMRRGNHILAFPIGLVQAAAVLIAVTVAVRLIVLGTGNMMILFNQETIDKTMLFHYLYEQIQSVFL